MQIMKITALHDQKQKATKAITKESLVYDTPDKAIKSYVDDSKIELVITKTHETKLALQYRNTKAKENNSSRLF